MKYFSVSNFKSFAKKQNIPIKPITLIYGANSAGKSSVIQSYLLLNHILKTGECDVRKINTLWDSVDIGGFKQYAYKHNYENQIEFTFAHSGNQNIEIKFTLAADTDSHGNLKGTLAFLHAIEFRDLENDYTIVEFARDYSAHGLNQFKINDFKFTAYVDYSSMASEKNLSNNPLDMEMIRALVFDFEKFVSGHLINSYNFFLFESCFRGLEVATEVPPKFIEFLSSLFIETWLPVWHDNIGEVKNSIRALNYIGPLRDVPPRVISSDQNDGSHDHTWSILLKDEYVRSKVNHWLSGLMDTPYAFHVENKINPEPLIGELLDLFSQIDMSGGYVPPELESIVQIEMDYDREGPTGYYLSTDSYNPDTAKKLIAALLQKQRKDDQYSKLTLIDQKSNVPVSLRDVGVGISQVIPVLVNAYSQRNRIIAIEQPEIHLHPKLQSELADVFIEAAIVDKKTFLIETHSEHLLLRIMRRIRETTNGSIPDGVTPINPQDVQILFVMPSKNSEGSIIKKIALDEQGELIDNWPGGFFEEGFNERFGL